MKNIKFNKFYIVFIVVLSTTISFTQEDGGIKDDKEGPVGIIGGNTAFQQDYPWMTSLVMSNGDDGCGATLIRPNWVLTAAHCVLSFPGDPTIDKVIINSLIKDVNTLQSYSEVIFVDSVIPHEDFNFITGPDIALIHLSSSSSILPIQLAEYSDSNSFAGNMPAKVLGWGITTSGGNMVDSLREANCIFVSDDTCADLYSTSMSPVYGSNPGGQVCAGFFSGNSPSGASLGDSGGPLFFSNGSGDFVQVGIVSGGDSDVTTEDYPGIFTLVPKYTEWINSTIESYELALKVSKENRIKNLEIIYFNNEKVSINNLNPNETYKVVLTDLIGRPIFKSDEIFYQSEFSFDLLYYSKGIYVLAIQNSSGELTTKKIIIE